ncbi:unnamed protein product, partial [Symbiodinium sp. CCMP2456]
KDKKNVEVRFKSFMDRFRSRIQRVNHEHAVHQRDVINVDAGTKEKEKIKGRGWAGRQPIFCVSARFSLNSLAFWMGVGTARNALCHFYLGEQKRGFIEQTSSKDHCAVIGYHIEFDETGQCLRLRNEQCSAETNTTLSVLVSRVTLLATDATGQMTNCKFVFTLVVNPPAVLQRKTATALWVAIEKTQPVPPLSKKLWCAVLDVIFSSRPDIPILSRWLTCASTSRFFMLATGMHNLLGKAWGRLFKDTGCKKAGLLDMSVLSDRQAGTVACLVRAVVGRRFALGLTEADKCLLQLCCTFKIGVSECRCHGHRNRRALRHSDSTCRDARDTTASGIRHGSRAARRGN